MSCDCFFGVGTEAEAEVVDFIFASLILWTLPSCMDGVMGASRVRRPFSGNQVDNKDMMDMAYI